MSYDYRRLIALFFSFIDCRAFKESEEDYPETVTDRFSVFRTRLLETFRAESG
jgi:hypothetical protein